MAEYYKGKTIDTDEAGMFLKIEGERYPYIEKGFKCSYDYAHQDGGKDFCKDLSFSCDIDSINKPVELGKLIIEKIPSTKKLEIERQNHIKELRKGVASWNEWRIENPSTRPILYSLNKTENDKIECTDFKGINLSNAVLIDADLSHLNLSKAVFHEANLGGSSLIWSDLTEANFCRCDLYKADLSGANLKGANLQGAQIADVKFANSEIINCKVYGSSAWDLEGLEEAEQENLEIFFKMKGERESMLLVDDLTMAQFLYFILNNKNLGRVFKATTSSVILILGSFKDERKIVLDKIRHKLTYNSNGKKRIHYIPIMFDFVKPGERDYTEVVTILAGISRFIIADLTNPRSIPQELQAIIAGFRIPLIPILKSDLKKENDQMSAYTMFTDYYKYPWVHPIIKYSSEENLFEYFDRLLAKAEIFHRKVMDSRLAPVESMTMSDL